MEHNKDGGTSVGFTGENSEKSNTMAKLWPQYFHNPNPPVVIAKEGENLPLTGIDFKISENIEQINKQQWEDIWNEWIKSEYLNDRYNSDFYEWLKINYLAPEKKNT